ncbi:oxidoreductase [Izhakiella australiensis]|uniref:Oxidoreductase n=1 Tax=Izhakiella australiensis TaxID=1926881 RepID=A0A1S8YIF9_9GAMM|nr:phosphoglycerate dehydrogenase [Izhakiella australiensis]OON38692.1 oxidoreductase [Izhakiella australiensis]
MNRILVTPRSLTSGGHPALDMLTQAGFEVVFSPAGRLPDEQALLERLPDCVGWLAGVEPVSERVIAAAAHLKVISRNGVGVDNLPVDALRQRGIQVCTADGANASGVAELAIALMFASLRHIHSTSSGIKQGEWPRFQGNEIRAQRLGVIGCGAIGREVARLACALGCKVLAFDPMRPPLDLPPTHFRWASLEEIWQQATLLTLHCPPPRDGTPLIGAQQLAQMPRGTIIINTARAGLVDDDALIAALDSGHLTAYAADVFKEEPPRSMALAGHSRVIATSHIGGFTTESVDRATEMAVANLLQALQVNQP